MENCNISSLFTVFLVLGIWFSKKFFGTLFFKIRCSDLAPHDICKRVPQTLKNEMWNLENIFQLSYVFVDNIIQENNCQAKLDLQHNIIRN